MSQNTSHAVMAQRIEPMDSNDFFPTPPWATRALCESLHIDKGLRTAWEPAAGEGHMVRPLSEYFDSVYASDIHDYGVGYDTLDFMTAALTPRPAWVITNPPFNQAEAFAIKGLEVATAGVALLVRTSFLEGVGRHDRLFSQRGKRPALILQFTERVPMHKGRLLEKGSTATSYCWILWDCRRDIETTQTAFQWIPPCRKQLERDGDYSA